MRILFLSSLFLSLTLANTANAQVFFQESFETTTGWNLSNTFDDGNNKFVKRDLAGNFPGLDFVLFGQDGDYVIGAENTDANVIGAPENGIVLLTLDETNISGRTNLQCVVSLACNPNDQSYDDRSFALGDYLADDSGLGFAGGALLIGLLLLGVVFLKFYTQVSTILLFWVAFIL